VGEDGKKKTYPSLPMSAYRIFFIEQERTILEQNSSATARFLNKTIMARWKALAEEDRKNYDVQARQDTERFREEINAWRSEHPDDPQAMIPQALVDNGLDGAMFAEEDDGTRAHDALAKAPSPSSLAPPAEKKSADGERKSAKRKAPSGASSKPKAASSNGDPEAGEGGALVPPPSKRSKSNSKRK
jgi:hypothetical protein